MVIALVVGGVLLSLVPWSTRSRAKDDVGYDDFLDQEEYAADPETTSIAVPAAQTTGAGA